MRWNYTPNSLSYVSMVSAMKNNVTNANDIIVEVTQLTPVRLRAIVRAFLIKITPYKLVQNKYGA